MRATPAWRLSRLLPALAALLLALHAAPRSLAHPDSASSPPLRPVRVSLKHQSPAAIVALFAREQLPASSGEHLPRAARSDSAQSLLPGGIDAVFPAPDPGQLVVVGTEAHPEELRACIQLLDVPTEFTSADRQKVVLTLRHADPRQVRSSVLRLGGGGVATASGRQLTLEGPPTWLHRAMRQVIRAELREPGTAGLPAR